jgi:hypothetical protein
MYFAARRRFPEFFTANMRNPHTRSAYARPSAEFAVWCEESDAFGMRPTIEKHSTDQVTVHPMMRNTT